MIRHPNLLRLVNGVYWLCLGGAFGATLMLAISATINFRTLRAFQPLMLSGEYNAPHLFPHNSAIIAGAATGATLDALAVVHLIFFSVVMICVLLQTTLFADAMPGGVKSRANVTRLALLLLILGLLGIERWIVSPRVWALREQMYASQSNEEGRATARASFDIWHKTSTRIMGASLIAMIAATLASSFALHPVAASVPPVTKADS